MAGKSGRKRAKVRGNPEKAQFSSSLAEIVSETVRIWRKHHLGYDQTKYVVEQARRRLKLRPLAARRRTVDRLDKSEIERLIRSTYQSHNKYGLMIKTLFLIGARVDEFAHIRIEDLHLDGDPPQIYLSHCKKESNRYVPLLPALAQELRTHLNGRCQGYLFETNRNARYSVRTIQSMVKSEARRGRYSETRLSSSAASFDRDDSARFRRSANRPGTKIPWTFAALDHPDLRRDQYSSAGRELSARHERPQAVNLDEYGVDDSGPNDRLEEPERLPGEIDDDTLRKYFTLTKTDLEQVDQCRGPANKSGFAIQLCTLRWHGYFLPDTDRKS